MSETQARAILIQSNSTYNIIAASKRGSENAINWKARQHSRGVGSIIGAVFVALIILSAFAFYAVIVNSTQQYNNTISSMSAMDWNRNQEHTVIKQIAITGTNQLNVTAENDGPIQSHLIWLGIFNTTAIPQNQTYQALINVFLNPAATVNIISSSTITAGNMYVIQLVTELGNAIASRFYPANYTSCALTLVATPSTVYQGNNLTVLFTVTPNDTAVNSIQSLTANLTATPPGLVQLMSNSSLSVSGLNRGTSAFFWWIYNAANTGTVTFNATYLQAPAGTYALTNVLASPQQGGGGSVSISGPNAIRYNVWQRYTVQATQASGNPIPYTYASLYANGTTVTFQNATDGTPVPNPAWLQLDANGTFQLQVRSTTSSGEIFVLYVAVGTVVQQKTITQAAQ